MVTSWQLVAFVEHVKGTGANLNKAKFALIRSVPVTGASQSLRIAYYSELTRPSRVTCVFKLLQLSRIIVYVY